MAELPRRETGDRRGRSPGPTAQRCDHLAVKVVPTPARRAIALEYATVAWSTVEAVVAVASGILAGSVALTAFGVDSTIEIMSAVVVLAHLRSMVHGAEPDEAEGRQAMRTIAILFFLLAAYVITAAAWALIGKDHPSQSVLGIVICAVSVVVMPALAYAKRTTGHQLDRSGLPGVAQLLRADASETALCGLLSATTLLGVILGAWVGWWWADPVASLVVVYFALREGREAWGGDLD